MGQLAGKVALITAAGRLAGAAAGGVRDAAGGVRDAAGQLLRGVAGAVDLAPQRNGRHVWFGGGRALVQVRGLGTGGVDQRALADALQTGLRRVGGVRLAQVNAVAGHVLVLFDDRSVRLADVVDAVTSVEEAQGTAEAEGWSRGSPPHPADPAPLAGALTALAADAAGLAAAVAGRLTRIGPVPPAARALVGLVEAQPRLRKLVERGLGPAGTDLAIGVGSGVVYGLTEGVAPLLVTAVSHLQLVAEVRSRRAVWAAREAELCAVPAPPTEHPPVTADRATPFPDGPVEAFADRVAVASLAAAGTVLALSRDVNRAAALLLIGVPPAARLGREAFAGTLARRLAADGVVPMDPGAFRRLDRVSAVVVDGATLGADAGPVAAVLAGAPEIVVVADDGPATAEGKAACEAVHRLQAEGHGVLVVAAGDSDALAAADVAVSVHRPGSAVGWAADLIGGPDLGPVLAVVRAVPVARRFSRRAVWAAGAGSAAAAVLTALSPVPTDLTMYPVYVTGLLTQADGALAARRVTRAVTSSRTLAP